MKLAPTAAECLYGLAASWDVQVFRPASVFQSDKWETIVTCRTEDAGRAELERIRAGADIPECFRLIKVTPKVIA